MMKAFAEGLIARGVPKFDILQELFAAPTGSLADDGKTYTITFSRSHGKAIVWTSTKGTILNFAESEGLTMSGLQLLDEVFYIGGNDLFRCLPLLRLFEVLGGLVITVGGGDC
jgi:hypothetical protein